MQKHLAIYLLIIVISNSCKTSKSTGYTNTDFRQYLITNKIIDSNSSMNDKLYDDYYSNFMKYRTKTKLEKNPYLKVNKVYVHYRTSNSVEFSVYSDEEDFCLSDYDLDMDGKILSLPDENGIVKVIKPIV
ncbi:hypothetical protein, partial [Flavobacterium covae]